MNPRRRGEDGATLLLVIGFMVMVGLMLAGITSQLVSGSSTRVALDKHRDREYAADAAIEADIAQVRDNMTTKGLARWQPGLSQPCPANSLVQSPGLNGVPIQVDCTYLPNRFTLSGFAQRDAVFTACAPQPAGATCPTDPAAHAVIIEARVNFASDNAQVDNTIAVDKTYIQSWSVKL